jgi:hypothetical protein
MVGSKTPSGSCFTLAIMIRTVKMGFSHAAQPPLSQEEHPQRLVPAEVNAKRETWPHFTVTNGTVNKKSNRVPGRGVWSSHPGGAESLTQGRSPTMEMRQPPMCEWPVTFDPSFADGLVHSALRLDLDLGGRTGGFGRSTRGVKQVSLGLQPDPILCGTLVIPAPLEPWDLVARRGGSRPHLASLMTTDGWCGYFHFGQTATLVRGSCRVLGTNMRSSAAGAEN